jgi:hypothetical protein
MISRPSPFFPTFGGVALRATGYIPPTIGFMNGGSFLPPFAGGIGGIFGAFLPGFDLDLFGAFVSFFGGNGGIFLAGTECFSRVIVMV